MCQMGNGGIRPMYVAQGPQKSGQIALPFLFWILPPKLYIAASGAQQPGQFGTDVMTSMLNVWLLLNEMVANPCLMPNTGFQP